MLGITRERLAQEPEITEMLRQAAGGLDAVLKAMRFSDDPSVKAFFNAYDQTSPDVKNALPWEALCIKHSINTEQFFGAVTIALQRHSANIVKVLITSHHPETMKARIRNAKTARGVKDRDAIDIALGLLPTPKGQTIINNVSTRDGAGSSRPEPEQIIDGSEVNMDYLFPTISDTRARLIERPRLASGSNE